MKKLLAKISSLVLIGASLIAGISCKLDVKLTEPATYIKISVNDNSRTIKPDVKLSDFSDFKLYQNEENEDNLLGSWTTFSTLSNAKIKIDEIHTFDSFILSAKCGESLYKDIQIAVLQEGENNLSFYLKPVVTDNKGTGNIEVILKVPEVLTITKDAETIFQLSGNEITTMSLYSGNLSKVEVKNGTTELTYTCENLPATMYEVVIQTKLDDENYILYCGYGNVSAGLTSRETTDCLLMNQKAFYTISFVTGDENVTINPVTVQKGEVRVTSQGNGNGSQKYLIMTDNSEIDITPDCEDKTLAGWYWDEEFTESAMSGYWKLLDRDLTLYAKWRTPVTLSFVSNVEDVTMEPVSIDSDLECQFCNSYLWNYRYGRYDYPEAEGYRFDGVYYDSEFTNKVPNGESITFTEDTTLYLKYATPSVLSFVSNIEDVTIPSITDFDEISFDRYQYITDSTGWISYPEAEGYILAGVYYDSEFNNKVPTGKWITITEDTTLYLKYVELSGTSISTAVTGDDSGIFNKCYYWINGIGNTPVYDLTYKCYCEDATEIRCYVFADLNGNNVRDNNEPYLGKWYSNIVPGIENTVTFNIQKQSVSYSINGDLTQYEHPKIALYSNQYGYQSFYEIDYQPIEFYEDSSSYSSFALQLINDVDNDGSYSSWNDDHAISSKVDISETVELELWSKDFFLAPLKITWGTSERSYIEGFERTHYGFYQNGENNIYFYLPAGADTDGRDITCWSCRDGQVTNSHSGDHLWNLRSEIFGGSGSFDEHLDNQTKALLDDLATIIDYLENQKGYTVIGKDLILDLID